MLRAFSKSARRDKDKRTERNNVPTFLSIVFLVIIITFMAIAGSTAENQKGSPAKMKRGNITFTEHFKVIEAHKLTYENYLITLKRYSYEPASEAGLCGLSIEYMPNSALLYHEIGYPPPGGKTPMAIFMQKKGPALLVIHTTLNDRDRNPTFLKVYEIEEPYNKTVLRIGGDYAYKLNDIVGDFDKDGFLEVLNLELKVAGTGQNMDIGAELGVRSIYRYVPGGGTSGRYYSSPTPHFERVKGRVFEKYFIEHAQKLIEREYPEYIRRKNKIDEDYPRADHIKRYELKFIEIILLNWLATVESTQNAKIIKEALKHLETIPFPDKQRKKELVKMLIIDGYPMLQQKVYEKQ